MNRRRFDNFKQDDLKPLLIILGFSAIVWAIAIYFLFKDKL